MSRSDFHQSPSPGTPFPLNRYGDAPLWWFAEESVDPDAVLALYNKLYEPYFPVDSVDTPRALLSEDTAWDFLDELIIRHLAKRPVHRFEEPSPSKDKPSPPDDSWVTFPGLDP